VSKDMRNGGERYKGEVVRPRRSRQYEGVPRRTSGEGVARRGAGNLTKARWRAQHYPFENYAPSPEAFAHVMCGVASRHAFMLPTITLLCRARDAFFFFFSLRVRFVDHTTH